MFAKTLQNVFLASSVQCLSNRARFSSAPRANGREIRMRAVNDSFVQGHRYAVHFVIGCAGGFPARSALLQNGLCGAAASAKFIDRAGK